MNKLNSAQRELLKVQTNFDYLLHLFGNDLAKREKYKDLEGVEAIHCYLIQRHHWLPSVVKSMTYDDIRLAMSVEMQDWKAPKSEIS